MSADYILESFEHAGFVCEIHADTEPSSPADWDQLGTLYTFRRFQYEGPGEPAPGDVQDAQERDRPGLVVRYLRSQGEYAVLFKFSDYGSNGGRVSALDSSEDRRADGYISTTRARFEELCGAWGYKPADYAGTSDEWVAHTLASELRSWDDYFQGNVCGYVVRDPQTGEVLDSVWDFYPDDEPGDGFDYLRAEVRSAAETCRDAREQKRREAAAAWALARGREAARPRLEYLRGEIRAERISYGELAELQGLAAFIDPGDVELLEWAGVPETSNR